MNSTLNHYLRKLGIRENAIKIYSFLLTAGELPIATISKNTSVAKSTVYDAMNELLENGLVTEIFENNSTLFKASEPSKVSDLFSAKIHDLIQTKELFAKELVNVEKKPPSQKPRIEFFSGREGIKKALYDILNYNNITTYTMWPMAEALTNVDYEFLTFHNTKRIEKNITLNSIRKYSDKKIDFSIYPLLANTTKTLRKIRYAPKQYSWDMSYWLYGNKCLFISSGDELFAFIVTSNEFASLMKTNWELVWKISKE